MERVLGRTGATAAAAGAPAAVSGVTAAEDAGGITPWAEGLLGGTRMMGAVMPAGTADPLPGSVAMADNAAALGGVTRANLAWAPYAEAGLVFGTGGT